MHDKSRGEEQLNLYSSGKIGSSRCPTGSRRDMLLKLGLRLEKPDGEIAKNCVPDLPHIAHKTSSLLWDTIRQSQVALASRTADSFMEVRGRISHMRENSLTSDLKSGVLDGEISFSFDMHKCLEAFPLPLDQRSVYDAPKRYSAANNMDPSNW
jgi:hypothetical protein